MSKIIKHPATKQADRQERLSEAAWISFIKMDFIFRYIRVVGKATGRLLRMLYLLSWTAIFDRKRYRKILNTIGANLEIYKKEKE